MTQSLFLGPVFICNEKAHIRNSPTKSYFSLRLAFDRVNFDTMTNLAATEESVLSRVSLKDDSSDDSCDGTATTGASGQPVRRKMEWKQSEAVRRSKTLVFLGVLFAAIAGGLTTGILVRRGEVNEFDGQVRIRVV